MNEYKRYDSDLSYSTQNREEQHHLEQTKHSNGVIIVAIVLSVVFTVIICSIVFSAMASQLISSVVIGYSHNNSDSNRDDAPLVDKGNSDIGPTAEKILENVVTVSMNATSGFLNQDTTICSGNGVFIRDGGYIMTSAYILELEGNISVTLSNGEEYNASVLGTDDEIYISVLKIDKADAVCAVIGNSDNVRIGDSVIGVGNKPGDNFSNPIAFGAVCAYDTDIALKDGTLVNAFQTDATGISGSIGGMLFNYKGELIGMSTAKYAVSSSDIGFATPINDLIAYANAIIDNTTIEKTKKLGISATDADYGVTIDNVTNGSLADKAGLKHGDLIIKINTQPVKTLAEIVKIKNSLSAGDEMLFTVYRNGNTIDVSIILE